VQVAKHFSTLSINPFNRKRLVQELLLKIPGCSFGSPVVPAMNITRTQVVDSWDVPNHRIRSSSELIDLLSTRPMSAWCSEKRFNPSTSTGRLKPLVTGVLKSRQLQAAVLPPVVIDDQNVSFACRLIKPRLGNSLATSCRSLGRKDPAMREQDVPPTFDLHIDLQNSFGRWLVVLAHTLPDRRNKNRVCCQFLRMGMLENTTRSTLLR
jgi:hypothetical protein